MPKFTFETTCQLVATVEADSENQARERLVIAGSDVDLAEDIAPGVFLSWLTVTDKPDDLVERLAQ